MATPLFRSLPGTVPTSDDVALREQVAALLAQRASAPRRMPTGTSTGQALGHGATQLAEALLARHAGSQARESKLQYRDGLAQANEALTQGLTGDEQKRKMIAAALVGMNPEAGNQVLSQSVLSRALAVPDPALELRREELTGARDDRRLAREQAAENLRMQIASREQAGRDSNDLRRQLAEMTTATTRAGQDIQKQIADDKLNLAKEKEAAKAPDKTSAASAQAFLDSIGIDANGEDDVSRLIKQSTGSGIGKLYDQGAAMFGASTDGAKAGAALSSRASAIVTKMLGGKLGAGISNTDRTFMERLAGEVDNTASPRETRLAAWNDLVGRMKVSAGVETAAPATTTPKQQTKIVGGKTYVNVNGQWFEDDGT